MPSTGADWKLRCTDHDKIDRFIKDLEPIAILHKNIIEANWDSWAVRTELTAMIYPELKRFRGIINKYFHCKYQDETEEEVKKRFHEFRTVVPNIGDRSKVLDRVIIKYDKQIEGNILIDKKLFDADSLHSKLNSKKMQFEMRDLYFFKYTSEAQKEQMIEDIKINYVIASKVSLYGFQFRVFESRWPMSDDDLLSFVFAKFPEYPELDGLCIELHDSIENQIHYKDPVRSAADFIIENPSISLRYLNEDVIFKLLTWINFFHFPDIQFDFGYGNNAKVKQKEINRFFGNKLLKDKALIEIMEYSYQELKYDIDKDYVTNVPVIDKLFDMVVNPERLEYRRNIASVAFGEVQKIKATFKNKVIYSELYKLSEDMFVAAPFFCEACGLHFGLDLERCIAIVKYIHALRLGELKASGYYFDIDLSKFDLKNYKTEDDFKNIYFHSGFCEFCDSEKKWIEMRQIIDLDN